MDKALCSRPPPLPSALLGSFPSRNVFVSLHCRQRRYHYHVQITAAGRSSGPGGGVDPSNGEVVSKQSYMLSRRVRRLWPRREDEGTGGLGMVDENGDGEEAEPPVVRRRKGNWVLMILRIRSIWEGEKGNIESGGGDGVLVEEEEEEEEEKGNAVDRMLDDRCIGYCDGEGSEGCDVGGDEAEMEIDRDSFSQLLRRVPLAEAKLYAKLSYLGSLAYNISRIKPDNLLRFHGLSFVTSSLEKRSNSSNVEAQQPIPRNELREREEEPKVSRRKNLISALSTYQIVASAASYLQSQTKNILPFGYTKVDDGSDSPEGIRNEAGVDDIINSEKASFVETTNSVTAVVAGKEEMKEAVAKDLNSSQTSPCEWFTCDDDCSGTRFFVIQGSESLASWQANLLFEPIQFEGLDVLVHRGIYEAAKGIYQQMLPEVRAHLESRGKTATLRFTGHSLGGSLSLLINLMLLIRGEAPASSLLPVITLGAPSIMCGGNYLLQKLGLPLSHVQAITMHRDIVPRAFSCTYPDRVTDILKAVNGNFRTHPCLKHQKLLYSPMGELLILQPDENLSPNHNLLPSGSGLYFLAQPSESSDSRRLLQAALSAFLNSPHPLEILSDRSAYGSDGTLNRDHDMNSYLKSLRCVIRLEQKRIRKAKRDRCTHAGSRSQAKNPGQPHNFSGMFRSGRESLKRFARIVGSQHMHMIVMFLLPARLLLLETFTVSFS